MNGYYRTDHRPRRDKVPVRVAPVDFHFASKLAEHLVHPGAAAKHRLFPAHQLHPGDGPGPDQGGCTVPTPEILVQGDPHLFPNQLGRE